MPKQPIDPEDYEILIKLRVEFVLLAHQKGEAEARRLWDAAPPKSDRRRPRGSSNPIRDIELVAMYDAFVKKDPSWNPAKVARIVFQAFPPGQYGSTEEGVKKKLYRLLEKLSKLLSDPNGLLDLEKLPDTTPNRLFPGRKDK